MEHNLDRHVSGTFRNLGSLGCLVGSLGLFGWSQPQEHHIVTGQVQIPAITQPLKLAEPNPIHFQSNGQRVTSVLVSWAYYNTSGFVVRMLDVDDKDLPASYDSDGGAFVNVVPLKLGKLQLMLFVSFADGGVERKTIDVQVVPPARQPEKLVIGSGGDYRKDRPVLYLDLSEAFRKTSVEPAAVYKDVTSPIPLNASQVTFKFISRSGSEVRPGVAEIDSSTGIVTAQYVGQALLETSFGEVSTLTCIDVTSDTGKFSRDRCEELLPAGRRLPPSGRELVSKPPAAIKVRQP